MNLPEGFILPPGAKVTRINLAALGLPDATPPARFVEPIVDSVPAPAAQPNRPRRSTQRDHNRVRALDPLEIEVDRVLVAVLELRGVRLDRNNSRVVRVPGRGGKERLMRLGLGKGSADRVGCFPGSGRYFAIEVKRPGNRPTAAQVAWLREKNAQGAVAIWCDCAEQLERALDLLMGPSGYMLGVLMDERGNWSIAERKEVVRG